MRTLIIGDVHGCLWELEELLSKCQFEPGRDQLIFVGDVINKGPDSVGVLKLIESCQGTVVLGNHEIGWLRYLEGEFKTSKNFIKLERQLGADKQYWSKWMKKLPLYLETDDFIVVHGGLVPGMDLKHTPASLLTLIRTWDGVGLDLKSSINPPWFDFYQGEKLVVFGHWAARGLVVRENAIGLDTGCVWGGHLSALELPSRKIIQVKAKQKYSNPPN